MKKKILLTLMVITIGLILFGTISVSAETEGIYTYTVSNGEATITDCDTSASGEILIPDTLGGYPVTNIGSRAFYNCGSLTSITIPDSTTNIGDYAFSYCKNLTSITLPDSLISIGYGTFSGCSNLTDIYYDGTETKWNTISISSNNDILAEAIIHYNPLAYLTYIVSDGKVEITDCDRSIAGDFIIPSTIDGYSVTSIGNGAFENCIRLASITIPDSVMSIGDYAFYGCNCLASITIPDGVMSIADYAFKYCDRLASITIPDSVTNIGDEAFDHCNSLSSVYYNGTKENWNNISIGRWNGSLTDATKKYFWYVTLINEQGDVFSINKQEVGSSVDLSEVDEKVEHVIHAYLDEDYTIEYNLENPISQNLTLYLKYVPNKYISKFVNDDGTLVKEILVDYGSIISPPDNPTKPATQQYSYTFDGWEGYAEGVTQENKEMVFKATYIATINQYTYKFVDEDRSVLKEETVDYGTIIIPPEINDKTEYYLFDYWQGYTENMTLTENVTFKALFKYKNYTITADGLSEPVIVTYNSNFIIEPQKIDDYHYFIGYFTEENGKGSQITNEKGESLSVYNVVGDLTVYPYFYEGYMNKVELQGVETAMPGDTITQSAIFATDKDAMYLVATVKYPKHLNFKSIMGVDFKEATKDSEKVAGDYKYADITCVFDYEGNFAEINTNYVPFEIEFDIATDIPQDELNKEYVISAENVMLIGDNTFAITDIKNHTLTILPKLAESIEIVGKDEIDATEQFSAVVSPDYTTDKSVVWSVNDETVATITQDGTVVPVKNGTVIITATAKDGSEVFATKIVNVIAYAKINSLDFGSGVVSTEFNPNIRKYTVYVKEDVTSISLTPTFSGGGVLRPNGSGVWVSGRAKDFELNDVETTITLNRENVTDMTNSVYTIEVIKFEGTKTEVSEDKKSFTITPINIENGKTVILALYDGEKFIEMQSLVYTGEAIPFTTTKTYTKAKVMVWDDITNLKPVCEVENIQ